MPELDWDYDDLIDYPALYEKTLADLPDTCVWKEMLVALFSKREKWTSLGFEFCDLYILTGKRGNGRHMLGEAIIGTLVSISEADPDNVKVLIFRANDFPGAGSQDEAVAQIQAAFDKSADAEQRFLIFDEMDLYGNFHPVCNALSDAIEACADSWEYPPPIVLLYMEDSSRLPRTLQNMALVVRTVSPSKQQRADYFSSRMEWEVPGKSGSGSRHISLVLEEINPDVLAELTEGFSYAELEELFRYMQISGLPRLTESSSGANAFLYCSRSVVENCLQLLQKTSPSPPGQATQIVNYHFEQQEEKPERIGARAIALADKGTRTFMENLDLIQQTE